MSCVVAKYTCVTLSSRTSCQDRMIQDSSQDSVDKQSFDKISGISHSLLIMDKYFVIPS